MLKSKLTSNYQPSFVKYPNDGKGRDTFISYNNGGFNNITPALSPQSNYKSPRRHISLTRYPKTIHYHSNGTGRDSYIGSGFFLPKVKRGSSVNFVLSLRDHSVMTSSNKQYKSRKEKMLNLIIQTRAKVVTLRLNDVSKKINRKK